LLSLREAILVITLVHEAILVVIPSRGHLGYYPSTRSHVGCYPYERQDFLFHYRRAMIPSMGAHFCWLVIILVQEAILIVIPTGGHLHYYPSIGGQQSNVETIEDLRRHVMSPG
jgi:hypothetical protein